MPITLFYSYGRYISLNKYMCLDILGFLEKIKKQMMNSYVTLFVSLLFLFIKSLASGGPEVPAG